MRLGITPPAAACERKSPARWPEAAFKNKGNDMETKKSVAEHITETWQAFTDAQRLELIRMLEQCADKRLNELCPRGGAIPSGWYRRQSEAKSVAGPLGAFVAAIAAREGR
jgi:hypothetical protein